MLKNCAYFPQQKLLSALTIAILTSNSGHKRKWIHSRRRLRAVKCDNAGTPPRRIPGGYIWPLEKGLPQSSLEPRRTIPSRGGIDLHPPAHLVGRVPRGRVRDSPAFHFLPPRRTWALRMRPREIYRDHRAFTSFRAGRLQFSWQVLGLRLGFAVVQNLT